MTPNERAALVRSIRCELKQEAVYYVARENERRSRARMDAQNRRNREVYGRIGERIDARIDAASRAYSRYETARARRINQRQMERIRRDGYDISPEFQARSAAIRNRAASAGLRSRAGTGMNRWRGSVAQVGADLRASAPANYDDAVIASRRSDPIDTSPGDYNPAPRPRRSPPGELRTSRPQRRRRN